MRILKIVATSALAAALLATTVSAADAARWDRRGPPVRGLFGAVGALVVGAATVATLPFAIAARAYYAPPPATTWYAAPPDVYGQSGARGYYYPPPPYNYAPGY